MKITLLIIMLLILPLVSGLDRNLPMACGGDEELIIGCLGDDELIHIGNILGETSASSIGTGPDYLTTPKEEEGIIEKIKEPQYLIIIGVLCLFIFLYCERRKKKNDKKKEESKEEKD